MFVDQSNNVSVTIRETFRKHMPVDITDILIVEILTLGFVADKHPISAVSVQRRFDESIESSVMIVNWQGADVTNYAEPEKISNRYVEQAAAFIKDNRPKTITEADAAAMGHSPEAVARTLEQLIRANGPDTKIVGHGLLEFSFPFLLRFLSRYGTNTELTDLWKTTGLFDTGLLFKATAAGATMMTDESFAEYVQRVSRIKGPKWNLQVAARESGVTWYPGLDWLSGAPHAIYDLLRQQLG